MRSGFILLIVFFAFIADAEAQDKKSKNRNKKNTTKEQFDSNSSQGNSLFPGKEQQSERVKKKTKKDKKSFWAIFNKNLDNKVEEFYDRMEKNAKRDKKMRRKMQHPKYSDFSYFGHKRKPKIRPVGKKKFCKECGIKH